MEDPNVSETDESAQLIQSDLGGRLRYVAMDSMGPPHEGVIESPKEPKKDGAGEKHSYEKAISLTGYGWFHYRLLLLCGWALSSDAIEVLSISFVLPPATCDLDLTDANKGWLTAIVFVGMMIGGYFWGALADIYGRRAVLLWSLVVNGLGGLSSSFSQDFYTFIIFRFISGIGVGGSLPVVFAYYTEFQPKEKRGSMISMLATFWMSGNIVAAALAWIVIPRSIGYISPSFTYNSWRIFLAVCTIPCLTSAVGFAFSPESPKFLMDKGHLDWALRVFQKMFKGNNRGQDIYDYPVTDLEVTSKPTEEKLGVVGTIKKLCASTASLFKYPYTRTSVILTSIFFTLSFGYYGLFMWFPELFVRMEKYGGSPCSLGEVNNTMSNITVNQTCNSDVSSSVYFESFLTAASNLPGNIFTIFLIDRLGRKQLLASSMVLSAVSVFFIATLKTSTQSLIMSCLFSGISVVGWNALDVIGMELYPTHLRSLANGFGMGAGRIGSILGNLLFGLLVNVYCLVPMMLVSGLLAFGGLSACFLPNTVRTDLQ